MQNAQPQTNAARDAGQKVEPYFILHKPRQNQCEACKEPPRFIAKHEEEFCYMDMGNLKMSKTQKRIVPDRIAACGRQFDVNAVDDAKPHSNGIEALRMSDVDSADYRSMLYEHKRQREEMMIERIRFVEAAAKRARRVCKADCVA